MSQPSGVYIYGDFSQPMSAQHNFSNQFDLENSHQAMSVYARIMHEHTKQQLNIATSSARRRSQGFNPTLSAKSSVGFISSTKS
ncbi:uncharacterized protein K441DRAFT_548209 [Cenococcum geophilum 1.58]|uniref:uncharacterized protein n=1 Tax=Cenococcum geophilum 1.58 TaxID=794803 RepID=UPI00358F267C|nr:hypothetical protein K441DRAFT_548209 [Cenococcum geophilum 1.58]